MPAIQKKSKGKSFASKNTKQEKPPKKARVEPVEEEDDQASLLSWSDDEEQAFMDGHDDDEMQVDSDAEHLGGEDDWEDLQEVEQEDEGDTAGTDTKSDASKTKEEIEKQRLSRIEQKKILRERKMAKPGAPVIEKAKAIWEDLRMRRVTKQERRKLMDDMMSLVSGRALDIIFKHDASRIVQCCVKYGTPEQRESIANELKGSYLSLSKSLYGRFLVLKVLKYCSQAQRSVVISEFYGQVRRVIRHRDASIVLEEAYSQYANAAQRSALMEEFYGPQYAIFKKTDGVRTLADLIKSFPQKKDALLKSLREALDSVLQKGHFNFARISILHRAIWEYLSFSPVAVAPDMIELLKDHIVHILHTREGAMIGQYCLLHASAKERKNIVKSFKGFVHSIACEQYGHAVLLSCFDCVDDTVLLSKALIGELFQPADKTVSVNDLLRNNYASKVFLYLLAGRNRRLVPNSVIQQLEVMDEVRNQTTKKDEEQRRKELAAAVSTYLLQALPSEVNELLRDKNSATVVVETVHRCSDDDKVEQLRGAVLQAVEESLVSTTREGEEEDYNAVKILKAEKDASDLEKKGLDMSEAFLANRSVTYALKQLVAPYKGLEESHCSWKASFLSSVWNKLKNHAVDMVKQCAQSPDNTSGTAFIFVAIFENGSQDLQDEMKKVLGIMAKEGIQSPTVSSPEKPTNHKDNKRKRDQHQPTESQPKKTGISILYSLINGQ